VSPDQTHPEWIRPGWPAPENVRAFTTTRQGGTSTGAWSGFNLGARCGDDPDHVAHNRAILNRALPSPVQWPHQVHGTRVLALSDGFSGEPEADAVVTFQPGRVCAVLTADCLPVFFCNRKGDRAGVAHAGWRGLADGVLQATVDALDEDPSELLAWLGPAIGPGAYEVGAELAGAFAAEFPSGFTPHGERYLLDLYALARLKLAAAGVESVGGGGFCTFTESDRFFSYRRDGVTGRMASLIWLESF
jgi:YfiH family protein